MVTHFRPKALNDLLEIRREHRALPFAGGTDLMVRYRLGTGAHPDIDRPVLFLDNCSELKRLEMTTGGSQEKVLRIGAAVTYTELLSNPSVHPALKEICRQIAAPGLRNIATIGGNICNASPAADTLPFLYAFDAVLELRSSAGVRFQAIGEFITGPGTTGLKPDEILVSIQVPLWKPAVWRYRKVGTRKANALTKVSFSGFADIQSGMIQRIALVFGAVGPTVIQAAEVEGELTGKHVSRLSPDLKRLLKLCGHALSPIDDQRSTSNYRRTVALNLLSSFLTRDLFGGEIE